MLKSANIIETQIVISFQYIFPVMKFNLQMECNPQAF